MKNNRKNRKLKEIRVRNNARRLRIRQKDKEGFSESELCNRNGCNGIIEEREREGDGCCCHINPPCGYCTQGVGYCAECGWEEENA